MQIFKTASSLNSYVSKQKESNASVGFVPTMGALHSGHLALVKRASLENDVVVVSIFVNPTQFNNQNDLQKYPRNLERDLKNLEPFTTVVVFNPTVEEMYGETVAVEEYKFGAIESVMEGEHRPGHFKGVATVVRKLFAMVKPDKAYFGEKDYQQLAIIRALVKEYNLPVEIVGHPIERANNGLALSSRNELLSELGREKAGLIFETMLFVQNRMRKWSVKELEHKAAERLAEEGLQPEYITIADAETLQPISKIEEAKSARVFVAAHLENIRLIDNHLLF